MCIYICVHIAIYMIIYICMYIYIFLDMYIYIYINKEVYIYLLKYIHITYMVVAASLVSMVSKGMPPVSRSADLIGAHHPRLQLRIE